MNNRKLVVILMIIVVILIVALVGAIVYIVVNENKKSNNIAIVNNKTENNISNGIETNNTTNESDIDDEEAKALAIKSFNEPFEIYKGENNSSGQIKTLISLIETNNSARTDGHTVNISTDGITKVEELLTNKKYKVELLTDVEGYVNEVIITENGENTGSSQTPNQSQNGTNDLQTVLFNSKFNTYIGDITGSKINDLLKIATESVNTDPSHPLTISSNNLTDLSEIIPTETYRVTPSYDTAGYINKLNIDKIM